VYLGIGDLDAPGVCRGLGVKVVLVSKILFLQELGPRAGSKWIEVYLDIVDVPLGLCTYG